MGSRGRRRPGLRGPRGWAFRLTLELRDSFDGDQADEDEGPSELERLAEAGRPLRNRRTREG